MEQSIRNEGETQVIESSDSLRDKRIANLRPFQKGQSGNPGGRSKRINEVQGLLNDFGPRALQKLCFLVDSDDERIALMAAKEIADRAYGKCKPAEDDDSGDKRALTINIIRYADGDKSPKQLDATAVSIRTLALPGAGG